MSRLWNRPRLCLYLGEDQMALCHVVGWRRPTVLHKEIISLGEAELSSWPTRLDAWLSTYPSGRSFRNAEIECVLGLPLVRYLVLPWDARLIEGEFREKVARALFARQFPDEVAAQEVRFSPPKYGRPQLASFVSCDLLQTLAAVARKHGLRLGSVEPLVSVVCRRFQGRLSRSGDDALLIAESGRLVRLQYEAGAITELQVRPCAHADLPESIQRLATINNAKVFSPTRIELAGTLPAAWLQLKDGDGWSPTEGGAFAFALCGVF